MKLPNLVDMAAQVYFHVYTLVALVCFCSIKVTGIIDVFLITGFLKTTEKVSDTFEAYLLTPERIRSLFETGSY